MKHIKKFNESSSERVFTLKDMERAFDMGVSACDDLEGRSSKEQKEIIKKHKDNFIEDLIKFGSTE
jgi:hypothetical protein